MDATLSRISKIKKIILWSVIIGGIITMFIPTLVHGAVPIDPCDKGDCITGTKALASDDAKDSISSVILSAARFITFISAAVAILFIVIAGIQMISSNGNDTQYKSSLNTIRYAVIGLLVTAIAYSAISILSNFITTVNIAG
jgi:Type IV secretion system pilin